MGDPAITFIVIDDSKLDAFIAMKLIRQHNERNEIHIFNLAADALEHIRHNDHENSRTIVFVDIRMPILNGFEFIEIFEQLPYERRKGYEVHILSSSVNDNDYQKAMTYQSVKSFIVKPFTARTIQALVDNNIEG